MRFLKRYTDEPEENWFEISEERVRMYLGKVYNDPDILIDEMKEHPGRKFRTQFAYYKVEEEK